MQIFPLTISTTGSSLTRREELHFLARTSHYKMSGLPDWDVGSAQLTAPVFSELSPSLRKPSMGCVGTTVLGVGPLSEVRGLVSRLQRQVKAQGFVERRQKLRRQRSDL